MSERVKRYGVVTTWDDDGTEKIGSHIEESPDGIYMLVSDYDRVESDRTIHAESAKGHIAENARLRGRIDALEGGDRQMAECCEHYEAKNTALDAALTEVCDERDKYHEDYMRLREALEGIQECQRDVERIRTLTSTERIVKSIAAAALKRRE